MNNEFLISSLTSITSILETKLFIISLSFTWLLVFSSFSYLFLEDITGAWFLYFLIYIILSNSGSWQSYFNFWYSIMPLVLHCYSVFVPPNLREILLKFLPYFLRSLMNLKCSWGVHLDYVLLISIYGFCCSYNVISIFSL